ncbi:Outer membrane protein transport protein domain-containing protein [Desulfonema limicola]|uniref:Outer membrane protein transport protein domain-containing protein n=1 Tax=Desulfonema limicola TaxID=45656 RepID=A0A975B4S8_9BACT|nr:outer membrane protein transport protein [Desulfonema limicola]QTA78796.1 Outer membrane protein transport protein domain-containing protein [Desulfonema limicola]
MVSSNNIFRLLMFIFIFILSCCFFDKCFADDVFERIEIPSSFNPVGSGARALGMGGAFIAIADDATAASWNPGGLIQLEYPEISLVYSGFHRIEDNTFGLSHEADGNQTVSKSAINYFSAAYPFTIWKRNMIISLSYQRLYDFTRQWDFSLSSQNKGLVRKDDYHYKQDGDLSAIGLAYCIQITPVISFGFTLNIWDDDLTPNNWERLLLQKGNGLDEGEAPFQTQSLTADTYSLKGINANLGIMWNATPKLSVGAVFKTPFEADLEHKHSFSASLRYPDLPKLGQDSKNSSQTDETLDMPMSYGIGIAYQFTRNFTLSADLCRTHWDDFILTQSDGTQISPVTGKSVVDSQIVPTHQVRIGGEYLFITSNYIIPLCAGLFYDPAPAPSSPDDIFGFSIGSGIGWKQFHFDAAYQYRFGNDVGGYMIEERDFSQNMQEHTGYFSVVVHF